MKKSLGVLVIFGLVMVFAGSFSGRVQAATVNVSIFDYFFQPQTVTVNAGDTITWTNMGIAAHTSTSGSGCAPDGLWDSGTITSVPFSRVFNTVGTFPYYCTFHCLSLGMKGTVVVNPVVFPIPIGGHTIVFTAAPDPIMGSSGDTSQPIGIGITSSTFTVKIALAQYAGPVDIYAAYAISTDPQTVVNIKPDLSSQNFSMQSVLAALSTGQPPAGSVPWMSNVSSVVNITLFSGIPLSGIPPGHYTAYLFVTPHGGSFTNFDLYVTGFDVV